MRTLHIGDVVRNTSQNWYGNYRKLVAIDNVEHHFRVVDGPSEGYISRVEHDIVRNQFNLGRWVLLIPDTIALPQGV